VSDKVHQLAKPSKDEGGVLLRCIWQPALFAARPKRFEVAALKAEWPLQEVRVRVHRNHSFEHVVSSAQKWMNWWGRSLEMSIGDYDDSLSFALDDHSKGDMELVWIDVGRFSEKSISGWLFDRIQALRSFSTTPIILATVGTDQANRQEIGQKLEGIPAAFHCPIEEICFLEESEMFSARTAPLTGTRLTDPALMMVARAFACHWIPWALNVHRKAIVIDLDNTLYSGVLGEQGIKDLILTPGYVSLQKTLVQMKERGILLALASRNEESDVKAMFEKRPDFPLRWKDFTARSIGWHDKTLGLREIAENLRIGYESLVFVDDNPGELASIASLFPEVGLVHAHFNPAITEQTLKFFPGLSKSKIKVEDKIRKADLEANQERGYLAKKAVSQEAYLHSLEVKLDIYTNRKEQLGRMAELSQKTNQFNLSLQRYSETDLGKMLEDPAVTIATIALRDRLSESGIIGLVVMRKKEESLEIEELCISCRALGRHLEDLMIGQALVPVIGNRSDKPSLIFQYKKGPRNSPGLNWLARRRSCNLGESGFASVVWWGKEIIAIADMVSTILHQE